MPLAFELDAIEALRLGKADHSVGQLDLAACAALMARQDCKNLRLQDIAPGNGKIRRRRAPRRLLDHAVDLKHVGLGVTWAYATDTILMRLLGGHFLHRNEVHVVRQMSCSLDHL